MPPLLAVVRVEAVRNWAEAGAPRRFGKPYLFGGFTPLLKPGFYGILKGWREAPGPKAPRTPHKMFTSFKQTKTK